MSTNTTTAPEYRECFKCWYQGVTNMERCSRCGRKLYTARNIRNRGIVGIITGMFLMGFMGAIAVWVAAMLSNARKNPESAVKRNAESVTILAIYALFALVIAFGAHSVLIGAYHLIAGRRSRVLIWIMWVLLFVLLFAGGFITAFL